MSDTKYQWGLPTRAARERAALLKHVEWVLSFKADRGKVRLSGDCERAETLRLFLEHYQAYVRGAGMAKKEQKRVEWVGFVDVKLSAEQDDAFDHWDLDDGDTLVMLGATVAGGYKFTLAYNGQSDSFVASLTGGLGCGENAGYTLSAFAEDWWTATRLLIFKHDVVTEGDWRNSPAAAKAKRG